MLKVYLSGEIHTSWREEIISHCQSMELPIKFFSPITDHQQSDDCGAQILGAEDRAFWHDHKAAKINAIRTRSLMDECQIVIVKFGEKYKQWNAAFDAGYAAAKNKSLIILHNEEHTHALKEIDAAAQAVASSNEQVVEILKYISQA